MALNLNLRSLRKAIHSLKSCSTVVSPSHRMVSTSAVVQGKRNFRKFHLGNKRGTKLFKRDRNAGLYPDIPVETEVRPIGFKYGKKHHVLPEMVPQFVVPDLTDCKLKPYVSYRAGETYQDKFTPENLYEFVYLPKLEQDFKEKKLDHQGHPIELSEPEELTPEEAWIQARKTGSDIFSERIPRNWECLEIDMREYRKKQQEKYDYQHFTDVLKEPLPQLEVSEPDKTDPPELDKTGVSVSTRRSSS